MKNIYIIIWTVVVATMFVSCERDEEARLSTISVSSETFTPSYNSVLIETRFKTTAASYYEPTLKTVYVQYSTRANFEEYEEALMNGEDYSYTYKVYKVQLSDLQDNTTYYIRYVASNRYSSAMTQEISEFKTLQPSVPTIALKSISDIWDTHAKAEIALEFDGGSQISEMGICWNTQTAPIVENNELTTKDTVAVLEIKDLQPNTQYFVRAYAINKVGVAYSEEYEFTTFSLPEIKTEEMTDVQLTTAMLHGTLVFNGNDTAAIKGFCWSTNEDPTVENNHIEIDTASAMYTYRLSNLIDETQYYVRAYAQNKIGIVYGETKSFTTMSALSPIVSINEVTDVDYHTATITADVISDGGADVTERGICYSTAENPTTESTKIISGKGTGSYTINLSNLQDSTTYYVRAYAINKKGIAYGEQKSFMTKGYMLPTITTANPTNVEYTSATVGGNISSDGGASVTECGICYSTTENPAIESNKIVSGMGTGSYTINLTDLQDSTTYYVRAYAINKKGIAYGEQKSFITKASTLPSVTTSSTSNISYTSATVGGNVTNDGGATVTERGVVYSTSQNPTTLNTKITSGSGAGSFTCDISNLQEVTTYYVRAYAINKKGTSYGEEISFTTTATKGIENGHEWVDLGLSVKWATMNVGASKAEDYGDYFAWGETSTKSTYDWITYTWCYGSKFTLTKYNTDSSFGTVDNKITLDLSDDAAAVNWGGAWRMPTDAEFTELREQCIWTWTTQNSVNGYKITSKLNGHSIFLPAAGFRASGLCSVGFGFYYWSSSLYTDVSIHAWGMFDARRDGLYRYYGVSVRPVCP